MLAIIAIAPRAAKGMTAWPIAEFAKDRPELLKMADKNVPNHNLIAGRRAIRQNLAAVLALNKKNKSAVDYGRTPCSATLEQADPSKGRLLS
jgi:hypothetical protein